jgi:hypothetical protein
MGLENAMELERRRDARFFGDFWVSIAEVANEPELQKGNVSTTGIFITTDKEVGGPGTVRLLHIATSDKRASINIMAHVARVISYDDMLGHVVCGAAFEFLMGTQSQRDEVERFVREVAEDQMQTPGNGPLDYSFLAEVHDSLTGSQPATVSELSLGGMVIETNWPVQPGELIRAEIHTPASQNVVQVEGRAVASQQADDEGKRYRVAVHFGGEGVEGTGSDSKLGCSMAEAMNTLLTDVTAFRQREERSDGVQLHGELSQVSLPSLLSFLDLERSSGVLELSRGAAQAKLYVREGRIVDLEMEPPGPPSKVLAELAEWPDGEFDFRFESVGREDSVGIATSTLLLHLAQRKDEAEKR